MATYHTKERIYIDADHDRLLPEGHEDAAYLFAGENATVTENDLKMVDAGAVRDSLREGDAPLVTTKSPGVRDMPTINPEQSPDVHAPTLEHRSSATDKVIANREAGLTAKLSGVPEKAGAVTDQDLVAAGQTKKAAASQKPVTK
jgi:hypothetical protein